ncbi:hypothetical protein [Emticicia sp. W12TSBA100-4]|jgi:hypothetical protein|uniref:hypothetical protein n=1 Tax=Emticicia sp. W12TSBA100-4 TaxID=3160965 RepID=UPI0033064F3B
MVEWERKEIILLAKGLGLFSIGIFLIAWFGNWAIYFWMNDVTTLPIKELRGVLLGLSCFFLGIGFIFGSVFIFEKTVKYKRSAFREAVFLWTVLRHWTLEWVGIKQKEEILAVEWQHFKAKELTKETNNPEKNIPKVIDEQKTSPKHQMLTRSNKEIIKTTQATAVLNEEDVAKIKISLNFTNINSKL